MALPYFYAEQLNMQEPHFTLDEATSKHCVQVLRMQEGEALLLTDGRGTRVTATIVVAHKRNCQVVLSGATFTPAPIPSIIIGISPVKNTSRFEWFLEKVTEVGISGVVPLLCKRTERDHFRYDRMKNILVAAMLQSQQVWLPELQEPVAFDVVVAGATNGQRYIAHCLEDQKFTLRELHDPAGDSLLLIGPEGDFTPEEIAAALHGGFKPVTLGNTRLRTETAGMVGAVLLRIAEI